MEEKKLVNQEREETKDDEQKEKERERRNRVYKTGGGKGRQKVLLEKRARMEKIMKRRSGGGKGSYSSQQHSPLPIHSRLCQYKEGVCELFRGCLRQDQSRESLA